MCFHTDDVDWDINQPFDEIDFQNLQLDRFTAPNGKGCSPKESVEKDTKKPSIRCYAVILWSPTILKQLDSHKKFNAELYSKLGIGKLMSDAVFYENHHMDWKQPFILVLS